jgi:ribonucleotide reductase alpha subunit
MSLAALQDYTFTAKYARWIPEKKRRETWLEAVERVENMHLTKFPEAAEEIKWAFDRVREKKVLGAQRALQFGGKPILDKEARVMNCWGGYCDRLRFFQEAFWILLCGGGVGFSVQHHHVAKLPAFSKTPKTRTRTFTVSDTIEGWADSLGILLATYFESVEFPDWEYTTVEFDYSGIRPEGAPLASSVGKAPGPEPLRKALEKVRQLLDRVRAEGFERLRPVDAYDLVMHTSNAVISGGVRRSATICLFSPDDQEMATAKTGRWFVDNPQRGRSNNSAILVRTTTSREEFAKLMKSVKEFGEPGFLWTDSTEMVVNPCFHRDTEILTTAGYLPIGWLYKGIDEYVPCLVDNRVGKDHELIPEGVGVRTVESSPVRLTQEQADIYELTTEDGHQVRATGNHKFPTKNRGRRELLDLNPGDTLFAYDEKTGRQFETKISTIEYWGKDDVFCLTQPETNTVIANGLVAGNCVEIGFYPVDIETGESGWQSCNLSQINGAKIHSEADFFEAAEAAAIIGTLQAGYTNYPYLGKATERIVRREALLGVSITGVMDSPTFCLDPDLQHRVAKRVVEVNERVATKIGINKSARTTAGQPAGTSSCILGTASGFHPHHARRYIRRVQANHLEAPLLHYEASNSRSVEPSVWNPNGTDKVIAFTVEVPKEAVVKGDLSAVEFLAKVRSSQQNWVRSGTVKERCTQPWLENSISNTVVVKPEEWDAVEDYLYENRADFAGVSLLPGSGDLDYDQAPMVAVKTPAEVAETYGDGSLMASGLIVDGLRAFDDNLWVACNAVLGLGDGLVEPPPPPNRRRGDDLRVLLREGVNRLTRGLFTPWKYVQTSTQDYISRVFYEEVKTRVEERKDWVRRAVQFADRYFDGDRRKMTFCLKDVHNWKLWCDLRREYRPVDYTEMVEVVDGTANVEAESACAGGGCEVQLPGR